MRHKVEEVAIRHPSRGGRHLTTKRTHPVRNGVLISCGALLVVILAAGVWVGVRGFAAKEALEHAQATVADIKILAAAKDIDGIQDLAGNFSKDTQTAVDLTSDPVWRTAELIPVLGVNLSVVRELAEVVNSVARDALDPVLNVASGGLDAFKPQDGRFDVGLYSRFAVSVADADLVMHDASQRIEKIDASDTVSVVAAAVTKLQDLVDQSIPLLDQASQAAKILPGALGADGPRNYIMLFQNNAESMSLGGNTAAWVVLNVDDGALKITSQPNSLDFSRDLPTPIDLPQSLLDLYNPDYFRYATNLTLRPDFPSDGLLAQAFWQRFSGQTVDAVVALDPIALSYLLTATGPLTLPSGVVLSAENAVPLLLSDVYKMYADPVDQDAFFAQAAASVFTVLTSSSPDTGKLIDAIQKAITDDRLLAWSTRPEEQAVIEETPLAGVLAKDNVKKTELGVFFVENSASKMSYYLRTSVALSSTVCESDVSPSYTASVNLHSDVAPEVYEGLSSYVRSGVYDNPVKTRTLVFIYGPPGGFFAGWSWDGLGLGSELVAVGADLGRPVAQIAVDLRPGEAATVAAQFTVAPGQYGPMDIRVTPMVQPTVVSLNSPGC